MMSDPLALQDYFIHLARGGATHVLPPFPHDGPAGEWYADYSARFASDGADGWLVSSHHFSSDWTSWEMHPAGSEVVICTSGSIVLIQEDDHGSVIRTRLGAGDYAINPPGIWHTADIDKDATAIFITCGAGTQQRPR